MSNAHHVGDPSAAPRLNEPSAAEVAQAARLLLAVADWLDSEGCVTAADRLRILIREASDA